MARKVQRPFCTIYKRSESERRAWNAAKELDAQKSEIEELKRQIEELKNLKGVDKPETSKRRTSKKETKEDKFTYDELSKELW